VVVIKFANWECQNGHAFHNFARFDVPHGEDAPTVNLATAQGGLALHGLHGLKISTSSPAAWA